MSPSARRAARAAVVALICAWSVPIMSPRPTEAAVPAPDPSLAEGARRAEADLLARHGEAEAPRIQRGVAQVLQFWRAGDGDAETLRAFLVEEFVPRGAGLDATFARFERALERIDGYLLSLSRELREGLDLDRGPQLPLDERLAQLDLSAHLAEDTFSTKVAFVALLNFPLATLEQRLAEGSSWNRRQWAEARLAERFASRIPAEASQRVTEALIAVESYINSYNIYMHHLLTADGQRPFPPGLRLITHWGLRDELKARYADREGLAKQRLIQELMLAIVNQAIPEAVINNPRLDWTPATGAVAPSPERDAEPPAGAGAEPRAAREPDTRYRHWLSVFRAVRGIDAHDPLYPNFIQRRFERDREMPLAQVEQLLRAVLESPLGAEVGRRIAQRLGRPLEPFDIWYTGLQPAGPADEAALDAMTRERYPTAEAFAADLPRILQGVGFSAEKARWLAERIVVDPSRGAGHALGAARRDDSAHLRTRVGAGGMDYKGYNIAIHELGHNVEQVFSMSGIDHTLLAGVPNTSFTEAMAFLFQARDRELLGLSRPNANARELDVLHQFWSVREIAGVSLVDIGAWSWLYANPDATPAQFREAVVRIAKETWNLYYAPILGRPDTPLLAIYSHLIEYGLYLPDYAMGHLIAFQVGEHFRKLEGPVGPEFERIVLLGRLTPDQWMRQAVGAPLSADPLLAATGRALTP
ncbi:MAG: hypothetical protein KBD01_05670 [Acidobacteria bacterium]|nr:hypothetical protein [Acidobacteriota bacterium]